VPGRLIGTLVRVLIDHRALVVIEPATGATVAEHKLVAPGSASILDAHCDGPSPLAAAMVQELPTTAAQTHAGSYPATAPADSTAIN
jgi:hypothetical protein